MYADIGMTRPRCGNAGVGVFAPWQRWPSDGVCDPTLSVDKAVFVFRDGDVFHMYDLGSVWRPVWVKIHDRKCYRSFHHPSLIATRITCVPNNQPSQAKTAEVDRRRLVCTGVLIICLYLRRWLKGGVPSNESVDVLLGKRKGIKRSGHKDQETHLPPSNCPCSLCHLKLHHIIRNSMRGNDTVPTFLLMQVCHWFGQIRVYNSILHTRVIYDNYT